MVSRLSLKPALVAGCGVALALACGAVGAADGAVRPIRFAPGADCRQVVDAVVRGARHVYAFDAREGQWAAVRVSALEHNAAVSIWRPGARARFGDEVELTGDTLAGAGEEDDATQWHGRLPASGTYLVVVGPTRGNANYRLRLRITAKASNPGHSPGC